MVHRSYSVNQPDLRRIGLHPNFWYPLAQSKELQSGKALSVSFGGEPIVLVRTASGKVFALEDRCAHRQLPLSMGVVCGEHLHCGYHAWRYSDRGIASIPYLPKGIIPPRGVRSYPARDAYGHIFIFPGSTDAEQVPFPDIPLWSSKNYKTMYFSRQVNCHYSFMHENLLDMNHQFLHRRLMGSIKPTLLENSKGQNWVEATYKFEIVSGKQHQGASLLLAGEKKDPKTSFDIMTIRTEYPYQTLTICRPNSDIPALSLWSVYVPVDKPQKKHHSFGLLMVRKPKIPGLVHLFWPIMRYFTEAIFAEDRTAVEAEQQAYELQGGDWNQEIFPLILDVREVLVKQGISLDS